MEEEEREVRKLCYIKKNLNLYIDIVQCIVEMLYTQHDVTFLIGICQSTYGRGEIKSHQVDRKAMSSDDDSNIQKEDGVLQIRWRRLERGT